MPYLFGIDGGASNCKAVLITNDGRVVYLGRGPGVNYHEVGASQVVSTIKRLFDDAMKAARAKPEECLGIGLGLAGVSREQDKKILTGMFDPIFGKNAYILTSDAEIALVSGTLAEWGILVIAGTGSIVYGKNQDGKEARAGGYGPLISDEGSGYRIAVEGLKAVARSFDGVEESNALTEPILQHLKVQTLDEMVTWVNSQAASREKIALIAPLVIQAAMEDDPLAYEIINQQADALALNVEAVFRRLELPDRFDVVLSGGVFTHAPKFLQFMQRKIRYIVPGANVIPPRLEPVLGSTFFAFAQAGITINDDLLEIIKRTYKDLLQSKP
jgi:N-acetylglucosamine kinase-like BadF-type ATPase